MLKKIKEKLEVQIGKCLTLTHRERKKDKRRELERERERGRRKGEEKMEKRKSLFPLKVTRIEKEGKKRNKYFERRMKR